MMNNNANLAMKSITDKERQLLQLLKTNARMSVSTLAKHLGISRTTAQSRLQKLEDNGVIEGYRVKLAETIRQSIIRAQVRIDVDPNAAETVIHQLEAIPDILTLYSLSGRMDYLALVEVHSTQRLDDVLDTIGTLKGVRTTESSILLKTKFDRR